MAVLGIRRFGDPVLRQRANELEEVTDLHRRLIENMIETMRDAPGIGLAATQVGVLERIFVYEVDDLVGAVINPEFVSRSDQTAVELEGCLSLPGLQYPVERSVDVVIKGIDKNGEPIEIAADDLLATVFQHEIDHLDGTLFIDRLSEDDRKEALRELRDQALGLTVPRSAPSSGEAL